jgi:hypothetical protein
MRTISIGETGPDWEPDAAHRYYAQRGDGLYSFGATEKEAFENLLKEEELQNDIRSNT